MADIHMFWFGSELPENQRVCLKSLAVLGYRPQLWVYDRIGVPPQADRRPAGTIVPQELAQKWAALDVPHAKQTFANYFRYCLMNRYGGWWVDTDILALKPLPEAPYVFTSIADIETRPELRHLHIPIVGGNLANGLFCVPQGCPIMGQLVEELRPDAEQVRCPEFGQWGTIAFTKAIHQHGRYHSVPLIGNGWADRFALFTAAYVPPDWCRVLHLYNYAGYRESGPRSFFSRFSAKLDRIGKFE